MTMLIASFFAESLDTVRRLSAQAWEQGAEAVEIRIDHYQGEFSLLVEFVRSQPERRWIVTRHGGEDRAVEQVRLLGGQVTRNRLHDTDIPHNLQAFADVPNAWVDVGLEAKKSTSPKPSKANTSLDLGPVSPNRIIHSYHDFVGTPPDIFESIGGFLTDPSGPTFKVAYTPADIRDSFHALDLVHRYGERVIAVGMGEVGLWTRVLAKKLGSFGTFCSLSTEQATAAGQVSLVDMVNRYRWKQMNSDTRVFGLIGNPVAHSLGPRLFNHWFGELGINAVYLPLRVDHQPSCLSGFLEGCRTRPWLDVGGFSVTIPHKTAVATWVGAEVDRTCERIGAVNTLVVRNGEFKGYNTDCQAAMSSLVAAMGCGRCELRGLAIDVLGAGGSARAVLSGLRDYGCNVTVYARNVRGAADVVGDFSCEVRPWSERVNRVGQVLINCSPIGMWPRVEESPMPVEALTGCELVFDLIYNPNETQLLRDANEMGIPTLNGLDMFIRQAAMQLELWTGLAPNSESARGLLETELRERAVRP